MIIEENLSLELQGSLFSNLTESSPEPGSDFELKLTLAMKRFSLDEYHLYWGLTDRSDPEESLTKKMNTVKIKENENKIPPRSPFFFQFGEGRSPAA